MRNYWQFTLMGTWLCLSLGLAPALRAQLVSGNAFLKGKYVEVGMASCGSFGSSIAPPAGFHANVSGLGFVADADKDGWDTGSPLYCGDYFLPGSPEEGWALEIDGTAYNNNQICGEEGVSGSITGYSEQGDEMSITWSGSIDGLAVEKEVILQRDSLFFVSQVTLTNTTPDTLRGVYYMRNVDPDQESPWGSGTVTTNAVVNQNPNPPCNVALVSAVGGTYGCYLGLGTKHPDARVSIGGFSNRSPYDVWHGQNGLQLSGTMNADAAISLAFNLGDLAPGQKETFAYAYVLSDNDINSALNATDLNFSVSNVAVKPGEVVPTCSGEGLSVMIENGDTYTWSWSPATGLNTTTGDSVVATVTSPTTYIATGTGTCGSVSLPVTVDPQTLPTPGAAGTIQGPDSICSGSSGVVYSVDSIPNATGYTWRLPAGATVLAGEGTRTIEVLFGNDASSGEVRVYGTNVCGQGDSSKLDVVVVTTDTVAPTVRTKNVTLALDGGGNASLAPLDVFESGADNCSNTVNLQSVSPNSFTCADVGLQSVTLTFDDGNGNVGTATATVTVTESNPPVPDQDTLPTLTGACSLTITDLPTATDLCAGSLTATTSDPLTYDSTGSYLITWRYDDGHGNTATQTQTVEIYDHEAPVPDVATLDTLRADCELTVSSAPTATDACAGSITGTTNDPLTYDQQGSYVIDWVYEDAQGNLATQTQLVIISNQQAPTPDLSVLPTLRGSCERTVVNLPKATDACGNQLTATTADPLSYDQQGTYVIEWVYEDAQGNLTTQMQQVIVADEQAPVPDLAELPTLFAACSLEVTDFPTATDRCDGPIVGQTQDQLQFREQGSYAITWVYEDAQGNRSTQVQEVVIADEAAPVPDVEVLPTLLGDCEVVVTQAPTATDACSGTVTATTSDPLTYAEQGSYVITWHYEDEHGNASLQEQEVVIRDRSAPVPDLAELPTRRAQCAVRLSNGDFPTATDNCGTAITGQTEDPLAYDQPGTYLITWQFEDEQGNMATQEQVIVIEDTLAPVPELAQLPTLYAACELTVSAPQAVDACVGTVTATTSDPLTYDRQGLYEITWVYQDGRGNWSQQTQQVVIRDTVAPTLEAPADVITCTAYADGLALRQVADNCSEAIVRYRLSGATQAEGTGDAGQEAFNVGKTFITYTVADVHGNERKAQVQVTREALTATISVEADALLANEATAYQWIDCQRGEAIAGATDRRFAPQQSGEYAVVISGEACQDTSDCVAFAQVGLAPTPGIAGLRLYPNPTQGSLTLELADARTAASFTLTDATGRVVLQREDIRQRRLSLDLSDLSVGVYVARIQQGQQQQTLRVVRQ